MFMGTRLDHFSPRAIVLLVRDYIDGRIDLKGFLSQLLYLCNLCRNCDVRCPSRIRISEIVREFRRHLARSSE